MENRKVLLLGSGEVGTRRALRFLKAGAKLIIIGGHISEELRFLGAIERPVEEAGKWVEWSDIVITASGDQNLNQRIADLAGDKLINRADQPSKGNVIVPSSFFVGDVQICIYTQGKSPLMARELRKKIQKVIREEDISQLKLQDYSRRILKKQVKGQKKRREYLYNLLKDPEINVLLKNGKFEAAQERVVNLIKKWEAEK